MDMCITYDLVKLLLANPPSIKPRPNFFNLRALRTHFARALKQTPCPQSSVNEWAGAVMSPEMYALIDATPFHLRIATKPLLQITLISWTRKVSSSPTGTKRSQKSMQNSCAQRITSRRGRTYIARCMIHSTCMSMTPLKWRP